MICGLLSATYLSPPTGALSPTTPVPKKGSIQLVLAKSKPDCAIKSFIQGTSFVLIPCDFIGGTITAIVYSFDNF